MKAARKLRGPAHLFDRPNCSLFHHRALSMLSSGHNEPRHRVPSIRPLNRLDCRFAGTKLRKSIEELPQGLQKPLEPFVEREASKYSPVIDEVLQNQKRFPKCVLLTRVGQFYEVDSFPLKLLKTSYISLKQRRLLHC